jgi:hypothetical protein
VRESRVKEEKSRVLEYARPGQQLAITLIEIDEKTTGLDETWIGSDRPDAVPNDEAVRRGKR